MIFWIKDRNSEIVGGFLIFGDYPQVMVSHQRGNFYLPELSNERIAIPRDGRMYILTPNMTLVGTDLDLKGTAENWKDYARWGNKIADEIGANTWKSRNND